MTYVLQYYIYILHKSIQHLLLSLNLLKPTLPTHHRQSFSTYRMEAVPEEAARPNHPKQNHLISKKSSSTQQQSARTQEALSQAQIESQQFKELVQELRDYDDIDLAPKVSSPRSAPHNATRRMHEVLEILQLKSSGSSQPVSLPKSSKAEAEMPEISAGSELSIANVALIGEI